MTENSKKVKSRHPIKPNKYASQVEIRRCTNCEYSITEQYTYACPVCNSEMELFR